MNFPQLLETDFPLLSYTIFSPLFGVFLLLLVNGENHALHKIIGIFSSLITFILSLFILRSFTDSSDFQLAEKYSWIANLGINFTLGIDGLSIWLVVLTTFLSFLVIVSSDSVHEKLRAYIICMLLLEVGMLGTFLALDAIAFYVFWEIMLIPMYFLIGIWGGQRRLYAAIKFVLYTAFGSLLMLVAIAYLGMKYQAQFGMYSFYFGDWMKLTLTHSEQIWLFLAFALAFSIKIPLFPFHTWLPDAHVEAPTGGSVILAGVLLKMGLYGIIRICVPIFPHAVVETAPVFAILGVVGIIFGALVAWKQTDMKKLVAYSSVSHLGFCVLGYAALNLQGMQGSLLQMLNHGVSTAALFFLVGVLYDQKHTRMIADYGGIGAKLPFFAVMFLIFTLSSIGMPLTNGFIGEFLIMIGGFGVYKYLASAATLGVIFGAIYMLSLYRRVVFGEFNVEKNGDLVDLSFREKFVFTPLLILVFVIGLYPQIFLSKMEKSAAYSLKYLEKIERK
ncbi:MAG: NADH-quinone oxidoreductase subunit M [Proteobacteria bacterium]|nr:NADH-quinone oxidoreductase subunit M [Pseudomonadota bacterium]